MKTVRGVQKNGLGVRCTLQQELGRVGWVCTGGVVMHVAYLLCVGVFLFGCLFRDDLRLRQKLVPPNNSVPVPETSKFSSKFPPQNFTHIIPRNNPSKEKHQGKGHCPFDALGIYLHTPPTAQSLFGAKRGRNNHRAGPHGFFFIRLA